MTRMFNTGQGENNSYTMHFDTFIVSEQYKRSATTKENQSLMKESRNREE